MSRFQSKLLKIFPEPLSDRFSRGFDTDIVTSFRSQHTLHCDSHDFRTNDWLHFLELDCLYDVVNVHTNSSDTTKDNPLRLPPRPHL